MAHPSSNSDEMEVGGKQVDKRSDVLWDSVFRLLQNEHFARENFFASDHRSDAELADDIIKLFKDELYSIATQGKHKRTYHRQEDLDAYKSGYEAGRRAKIKSLKDNATLRNLEGRDGD